MVGLSSDDSKVTEVIRNSVGCRFRGAIRRRFCTRSNELPHPYSMFPGHIQPFGNALQKAPDGRWRRQTRKLRKSCEEMEMLWIFFVASLVLWLVGFGFSVAGGFIHLLLVAAFVLLLISILNGRRRAAW